MMTGSRTRRIRVLALCGALAACGIGIGIAASAPAARTAPAPRQALAPSPATPLFAYYYIWFSRSSWSRAKKDLPLIGGYSSSDPAVLRHQIRQAKSAGIGGFIVSWKDTPLNDVRLRLLMTAAAQEHFKLAMIYQGLDFYRHPLPASTVAADFVRFRDEFASSPVFFRVDGKPLTIWSGTWAFSYDQVAQVTGAVRPGMLVLCTEKNVAGFNRVASITDGDAYYWSSVNPATQTSYQAKLDQMSQAVHREGKYWIAPLAPGFDARMVGGERIVPRNDGQTLRTEYATAARSSPNMLGLISWNEFSENSHVEPSKHYGYQSLDVLRQLRGTPAPNPASPTSSPAPTLSPWPNVLRLSAFVLALVVAVALLSYARRRHSHRRSGHRPIHR
jgi:Glycosyl hydrolase family 71